MDSSGFLPFFFPVFVVLSQKSRPFYEGILGPAQDFLFLVLVKRFLPMNDIVTSIGRRQFSTPILVFFSFFIA